MGFRRRRWRDLRPEQDKIRVNKAIRVPEVRVVNEDGQQLGVMATDAAKDVAHRSGLDLVEISPQARPPVCKIMDYGRFKYEQKKKASTAKKSQHQTQVKEIKLRPRISDHDLDFKLKSARKFLIEGDKVKCRVMFRGREIVFRELGFELLRRVEEILSDISGVEQAAAMEGRILAFTLSPNRTAIEKLKQREEQLKKNAEAAAAKAEAAEAAEAAETASQGDDEEGAAESPAEDAAAEQTATERSETAGQEA